MQPKVHSREDGFTLIELIVAIVVVAVLAAVALPTFLDQVRKSRRSDAIATIARIQQAQERWRAASATFNTDSGFAGLGVTPLPTTYYTYAPSTPSGATSSAGYGIAATAVTGSSQSKDNGCQYLRADVVGGGVTYFAGTSSGAAASGAAASNCWRR
jgi:type IV pilus assembly protein PilE